MRLNHVAAALLLGLATPAVAAPVPAARPAPTSVDSKESSAETKADDFDIGKMMGVFDKIFPAQAEPLPQRLALSKITVKGLFPDGTYQRMMGGVMSGVVDRVMGLSEADFGKSKDGKPDTATLRQQMAKDDPHFEERMRIGERVLSEEMGKIAAIIEPRLREGLARSMARRFDEKQLADINSFLATDSGRAFGSQSMAIWVDPEVMRSMVTSLPEIMKAMPAGMKRLETETAHLPKPKPKPDSKAETKK